MLERELEIIPDHGSLHRDNIRCGQIGKWQVWSERESRYLVAELDAKQDDRGGQDKCYDGPFRHVRKEKQ